MTYIQSVSLGLRIYSFMFQEVATPFDLLLDFPITEGIENTWLQELPGPGLDPQCLPISGMEEKYQHTYCLWPHTPVQGEQLNRYVPRNWEQRCSEKAELTLKAKLPLLLAPPSWVSRKGDRAASCSGAQLPSGQSHFWDLLLCLSHYLSIHSLTPHFLGSDMSLEYWI